MSLERYSVDMTTTQGLERSHLDWKPEKCDRHMLSSSGEPMDTRGRKKGI
jgi:hypothetical protein